MKKEEKRKKYCGSCRDNFYNHSGNSTTGECWGLEDAEVVRKKFVHIDQRPPWNQEAELTLNCCNRDRYISVGMNVIR